MTSTPLENLEAHILRFVCEVETPLRLYAHKGSALRGAWVQALLSHACPQPWECAGASCLLPHGCPIAALVGPADEVGERGRDVPRPYVLEPPLDSRIEYAPGDTLEWRMVLFGRAVEWFPYVIMATRFMGEAGLGVAAQSSGERPGTRSSSNGARDKGRFWLREIWAVNPLGGVQQRLYAHGERDVELPGLPITAEQVTARARRLPADHITLNIKTPLRLGQDRQDSGERRLVHAAPPFETLIRRLDGRLRDLTTHYTTTTVAVHPASAQENPPELYPEWPRLDIEKARGIAAAGKLEWLDLQRYSSRQERRLPMGGLRGRVQYTGDLEPFLPLLVWGQFAHVGKYAVMGNGGYDICI